MTATIIGPYFCWEIPAEGVAIYLHLNIVQLLDRDAIRAGHASAAGVLLGRMERGRDVKVIVEGYEAVTPERGATESPLKDRILIESITDRWRSGHRRMSTVGFYRTCGREGAALSKEDLDALDASVIARAEQSGRGGNSVTEQEQSSVGCTRSPFKLDVQTQMSGLSNAAQTDSCSMGLERVFVLIEPHGCKGGRASLYLSRGGAVLCQSPRMPFNRAELSKKGIVRQSPGASMSDLALGVETPQQVRREPERRLPRTEVPKPAINWRWLLASAVFIAILGEGLFRVSGQPMLHTFAVGQAKSNETQLGLKVQRKGTDLELTWNQAAPILAGSKKARLRIIDDFIHKNIDLDSSELRNGRIVYTPVTDNVFVQLEVEGIEPANGASESVRVVGGLVPPISKSGTRPIEHPLDVRNVSRSRAPASPQATASERIPDDTTAGNPRPKTSSDRADAPELKVEALAESSEQANQTVEHAISSDELPLFTELPETLASSPPNGTDLHISVREPTQRGGAVVPPELISRRDPIYPPEAKRRNISGSVEVHFTIGTNGKVQDITAVKGDRVLSKAAIEAVREWRYKPARLDGAPTEARGTTVVNFRPY